MVSGCVLPSHFGILLGANPSDFSAVYRLSVQSKLRCSTNDEFGGRRTMFTLPRNSMGPGYGKHIRGIEQSNWY
jgi:hypothetical protein